MNFLIPFFGAILGSGATIVDKVLLGGKGITYKNYSIISFMAALFVAGIAFISVGNPVNTELFVGYAGFLLIFTTIAILTSNLLYFHALKHDQLTEMETVGLLSFIPVIGISYIFYEDERSMPVLIAALIASIAVIWSHWRKGHPFVRKSTYPYLIWLLFIAPIQAIAFKEIFLMWDPISLQFVREIIIVPILGYMYADTLKSVSLKSFVTIFITGAILTLSSILFFISYSKLGIIHTTLIFSLQPLVAYIGALLFLKEKFHRNKFLAFLVVLVSITAAQLFK